MAGARAVRMLLLPLASQLWANGVLARSRRRARAVTVKQILVGIQEWFDVRAQADGVGECCNRVHS